MASHSNILVWRIQWTEEPAGCRPQGRKEADVTEATLAQHTHARVTSRHLENWLLSLWLVCLFITKLLHFLLPSDLTSSPSPQCNFSDSDSACFVFFKTAWYTTYLPRLCFLVPSPFLSTPVPIANFQFLQKRIRLVQLSLPQLTSCVSHQLLDCWSWALNFTLLWLSLRLIYSWLPKGQGKGLTL